MKIPLALQLLIAAAVPLWLTACTDAESRQRPRLLANEAARIGDLRFLETVETAPDQFGAMIDVRMMSCAPSVGSSARTPRLVIGEPVCTSGTVFEGVRRID